MGKRLKTYVHVHGDDGENYVYGPEDDVPKAHAEKIGDHAWVDDDEPLEDNRPGVVIDNAEKAKPPKRPASSSGSSAKAPSRRSRSTKPSGSPAAASGSGSSSGVADGAGAGGASADSGGSSSGS